MVRVRRQNLSNRTSIPIRNRGVRRRSTRRQLQELALEDNHSLTTEAIIERTDSSTFLNIQPVPSVESAILPDYVESEGEQEINVDPLGEGHNDFSFIQVNPEPPYIQIPLDTYITWEQGINHVPEKQDKQTQYPEVSLSPNYSPILSREYSPVLNSFPRWYLLPEEDPEQLPDNPFDFEDL